MSVRVRLSRSLLMFWEGAPEVELDASTVAEAISGLEARFPGMRRRVLDDQGRVRRHVLVFVNADNVAGQAPADVRLSAGDTLHILPAVSGGE